MNTLKTAIITRSVDYSINRFTDSNLYTISSFFDFGNTSVSDDNNKIISDLQKMIVFKNEGITEKIINNKDLLKFLDDALKMIAQNNIMFHADLELISTNPNDMPQLLLVYYPINYSKSTSISIQKELTNNLSNSLYRKIIKHLFTFSIAIKKSIIVDEQIL